MGLFYKATIQVVLFHGAETWNLMAPLLHMLQSFHNCCAQYLARLHNVQLTNGTWSISPATTAWEKARLFTIEEYIQQQVNTFVLFTQSCTIYQTCQTSQATQAAARHPCCWVDHLVLPTTAPNQPQHLRSQDWSSSMVLTITCCSYHPSDFHNDHNIS